MSSNHRIRTRLVGGFGLCILLLLGMVAGGFLSLLKLEKLYLHTEKRAADVRLAVDAQHMGQDLNMVIYDYVVQGPSPLLKTRWEGAKVEARDMLRRLATAADTEEERALVRDSARAVDEIERVFESEMLPLLLGNAQPGGLRPIDGRIDSLVDDIQRDLRKVTDSMVAENAAADGEYEGVLGRTMTAGLLLALSGVGLAIWVSALVTRRITQPLASITDAATQIKNGNYHPDISYRAPDEMGILASAFREMSEQVSLRTAELQALNDELRREVAERHQAEEKVLKLNAELEERVSERTWELLAANEQCRAVIALQQKAEEDLTRSRQELRDLNAHLQSVRERERTRISREIHDELGQSLTALKLDTSWLSKRLNPEQVPLAEKTSSMITLIDSVIGTVKRLAAELRPGILDDLGLPAAIEWEMKQFAGRTGIDCRAEFIPPDFTTDVERSTTLFRVFQETLTNIARHAEASEVRVLVQKEGETLTMVVSDNGRGISEAELRGSKSLGLLGMRERIHLLNGRVVISGSPGEGTSVTVTVPAR
ncbi:MAG TPA: ATP-binding protein [Verrucomicrobiae bacterium]|nr:ATP-binding protein [Verrucomicrobiae bacterium]